MHTSLNGRTDGCHQKSKQKFKTKSMKKFCYKIDKTIYDFSNEIADCCSSQLATLPQKDFKHLLTFFLKI